MRRGDHSAADAALTEALALREARFGSEHPLVLQTLNELASVAIGSGDLSRAESLLCRALAILESQVGAEHPSLAIFLGNIAAVVVRQGRPMDAEPVLTRLYEMRRTVPGEPLELAAAAESLAGVRHALGRLESAELLRREALRIRESALGAEHHTLAPVLDALSESCAARGNIGEATALAQRALALWEQAGNTVRAAVTQGRLLELQLHDASAAPAFTPRAPSARPALRVTQPTQAIARERRTVPPSPLRVARAPARRVELAETPAFGNAAVDAIITDAPAASDGMRHALSAVLSDVESPSDGVGLGERLSAATSGIFARLAARIQRPNPVEQPAAAPTPISSSDEELFSSPFLSWRTAHIAIVVLGFGTAATFLVLGLASYTPRATTVARSARVDSASGTLSAMVPSLAVDTIGLPTGSRVPSAPASAPAERVRRGEPPRATKRESAPRDTVPKEEAMPEVPSAPLIAVPTDVGRSKTPEKPERPEKPDSTVGAGKP